MASAPSDELGAADAQASSEPVVNVQIVSPSVGVNRPLLFPGTPASTTIKQLKEKIREALPLRPADEHQRLIHRGRALMRDSDSLLDVLGAESIQQPDQHTIHLVIRDFSDNRPSSTPAATPTVPLNAPPNVPQRQQQVHSSSVLPEPAGFSRRPQPPQSAPPTSNQQPHIPPQMPGAATAPLAQQLPEPAAAVFQQQHQQLTAWLSQIQRDAMTRAIVNQNQRGRAQGGMRGIGDSGAANGGTPEANSGRGSPAPTHTVYREVHGPNGHSYHVETVIRPSVPATAPQPGGDGTMSGQHAFRASSRPPTGAIGAAMQRSTSGASLPGRSFTQPGVTVPMPHIGGQRPDSGRATPDTAGAPRSVPGIMNMFSSGSQATTPSQAVELYLLSSPEGPRGVLINNATMEAFYTPRATPIQTRSYSPPRIPGLRIFDRPELNQRQEAIPQELQNQQPVQHQQPANGQEQPAPVPQGLHPNNAAAVGGQGVMLLIMSYAWQMIRLGFFVWMFTSADVSWTRWFVIVFVAALILAAGSGYLTSFGEFFWRPVDRHMEHVFAILQNQDGLAPRPRRGRDGADPDPADMAARLAAGRQRRRTRLAQYYRNVKRVGILFLASIAPGVAERQIALLEAEAREEERRQREALAREEAATAQAAASTEGQDAAETGGNDTTESVAREEEAPRSSSDASPGAGGNDTSTGPLQNDDEARPAQEPLIAL